ncbi:MAG: HAD-IA family hydrolase [Alphaproteobacteria bacterium]|mgnify:CR=1 FL=1|jgi:phosphoglycolate phosphatase|nr:HAD-IA family hydrolase [Alphaproteobacteria bacterium]MDP6566484.1 HAD-IA family hydrolase [Alphaproteobacteria bacterium]MDP6813828.1 HAD-IA family hydrolase [Alphaproteobacteria bacterium]
MRPRTDGPVVRRSDLGEVTTLRLVILDCDGTLVDSQQVIVATMHAAFGELDLPPPPAEAVRRTIGLSLEEVIARLAPAGQEHRLDAVFQAYRRRFFEWRTTASAPEPLFPHAGETIEQLMLEGFLLGVATGKSRRGLDAVLASHDLQDSFVTLQTADRHPGKPHPAMLHQAMAETGARSEDTIMVGDTSYDMEMAVNAGVMPVGVAWGYHDADELRDAGAMAVLDDFRQLLPLLTDRWAGR